MENQGKKNNPGGKLQILRREESRRSRQYRGVFVSVLYERDSLEVLSTVMEPGSALNDREIGSSPAIHFVIDGSPVFVVANQSGDLIPGDSISLQAGESYRISNPASLRATILTILDKGSEEGGSGGK